MKSFMQWLIEKDNLEQVLHRTDIVKRDYIIVSSKWLRSKKIYIFISHFIGINRRYQQIYSIESYFLRNSY